MEHLRKSFDAFFSSEAKVAVIKGSWGVGKTHFWNSYIAKRISEKNLNQIAYSYISLFGKTSLPDLKKSLFHSAKAISTDTEIESAFDIEFTRSSSLLNKVPWVKNGIKKTHSKTPWLNWVTKNAQDIPVTGKFSNIIASFEYALVNNYIICFDDLERKGNSLSIKEIMGLVDELALRKNCKIVLIFNESSLDKDSDKKEFDLYREKVVDIELSHEPTCVDNLKHVFSEDYNQLAVISEVINELDIKNIRVLKKIRWMIEKFEKFFDEKSDPIREEFLTHAVLLCWGYFISDKELSFEELKNQLDKNSWMSCILERKEEKTSGEIRYSAIACNLKLFPSKFDQHIIHYLERGFVNEAELKDTISNLTESVETEQVKLRLRKAWDIYSSSFSDNLNDFKSALKDILDEDISKLDLSDFSSAIDILAEFGDDVSSYIDTYVEIHKESLKSINPYGPLDTGRVKIPALREAIEQLHNETKSFNIDDIAEKIAVNRGWSREDINFLSSLDKSDFYSWMKSNPDKLTKKVRGGLLQFRNLESSDKNDKVKYEKIASNVVGALKDIASENELNKKRIKFIYEIE